MGRSTIMSALLLVPLCAVARGADAAPAAGGRPNVVMISIDDLNDWVGPLGGHPQVRTPHMDRLAARGVVFTNAHCQAPLCNPSRASLLTGLRPGTTGVYALEPWFRDDPKLKDHETLFQYFRRHGYRTMTCGKVFHDAYPPAAARRDGGPEVDVWGVHGGFGKFPARKFADTPAETPLMDWGAYPESDEACFDYDVASWAVEQLKKPPEGPFFLAVGLRHPHVPCYAPAKWFEMYPDDASLFMPPVRDDDRADLPRFASYLHWSLPEPRLKWLRENDEWRPLVRAYLASVSFADAQVGRVLDALKESGLEDKTVVVLWSDHGWHLGEKGITGKNSLWERSTRVPVIFAGPGVAQGARCERPAELLDVYPTLAELCGLPAKEGIEGVSLAPQLKDANAPRERPAVTTHGPGNHAVRSEAWRYIRYADGSEELYDVRADPNEWTNLAASPDLAHVKNELARWLPAHDAPPMQGSRSRLLTFDGGVPVWEGRAIGAGDPLPER
jgi:choline-sulfatase